MSALLDTAVVLASLDADEPVHEACAELLSQCGHWLYAHAPAETFSILSGGRKQRRIDADLICRLLDESVLPFVRLVSLDGEQFMSGLRQAKSRGVRGGAVYDFLHLMAARNAGAKWIVTLDRRNFEALAGPDDPLISMPGENGTQSQMNPAG